MSIRSCLTKGFTWILACSLLLSGCSGHITATPETFQVTTFPTSSTKYSTQTNVPATATHTLAQATSETLQIEVNKRVPECGFASSFSYSPDGQWVAFECLEPGMGVYNIVEPSKAWYFSYHAVFGLKYQNGNHFGKLRPFHWSGDGNYLYFTPSTGGDGGCPHYREGYTLLKLELSTGLYTNLFESSDSLGYYDFSFSNNDAFLVYVDAGQEQKAITLEETATGNTLKVALDKKYATVGDLIWSPDDTLIAFSARTGEECEASTYDIIVMDLKNHHQSIILGNSTQYYRPIQWLDNYCILVDTNPYTEDYYELDLQTGKLSPHSQ